MYPPTYTTKEEEEMREDRQDRSSSLVTRMALLTLQQRTHAYPEACLWGELLFLPVRVHYRYIVAIPIQVYLARGER